MQSRPARVGVSRDAIVAKQAPDGDRERRASVVQRPLPRLSSASPEPDVSGRRARSGRAGPDAGVAARRVDTTRHGGTRHGGAGQGADHGPEGSGEPLSVLLRAGNAGSNTAAEPHHRGPPGVGAAAGHRPGSRPGRRTLILTDGAGASHAFPDWLAGQRLSYSIGATLPDNTAELLQKIPAEVWTPAHEPTIRSATGPGSPSSPGCWT